MPLPPACRGDGPDPALRRPDDGL